MKTARDLMLAYLAGTSEESGALFADNGTLELCVDRAVTRPDGAGGDHEVSQVSPLHTPEQVFAEYQINHRSGISGKDVQQQFFGHLQADGGKIVRLREAIDVVVAAEAIYPNGLADVLAKRS